MSNNTESQQEIINNFGLFDDWLDKYQYIIDLGKALPEFPEQYKQEQYKIKGCQSNVWMYYELHNGCLNIQAISDSAIVNGLIYLLLITYNNKPPQDIINTKPEFITAIGLDKHLSPTRKNGLYAMLQAINNIAVVSVTRDN